MDISCLEFRVSIAYPISRSHFALRQKTQQHGLTRRLGARSALRASTTIRRARSSAGTGGLGSATEAWGPPCARPLLRSPGRALPASRDPVVAAGRPPTGSWIHPRRTRRRSRQRPGVLRQGGSCAGRLRPGRSTPMHDRAEEDRQVQRGSRQLIGNGAALIQAVPHVGDVRAAEQASYHSVSRVHPA